MIFKTPEEFLQAYFEAHLQEKEKAAFEYQRMAERHSSDEFFKSASDDAWGYVDFTKNELNDFLDGKLEVDLCLLLWARLATLSYSDIDPEQDCGLQVDWIGEVIYWTDWLCRNEDLELTLQFFLSCATVECMPDNDHKSKRRKVTRRAVYDKPGLDHAGNYLTRAIILALIAAYDLGMWQTDNDEPTD